MQPKAAKKIGGMTPKKMTGGDYGEPKEITIDGVYRVTKKIDEAGKQMMICVETDMPSESMVPPATEPSATEPSEDVINQKLTEMGIDPDTATPEEKESAKQALQQQEGGKKKRKSSKKRKSMKKKGGMKRKSMKVKA